MLICDDCQKKREMQIINLFRSLGTCECCGKTKECADIHHEYVPELPTKKRRYTRKRSEK